MNISENRLRQIIREEVLAETPDVETQKLHAEREALLAEGAAAERAAIVADLRDELRDIKRYGAPDDVAGWLAGVIAFYASGGHRSRAMEPS
jgi:hypothetical protein